MARRIKPISLERFRAYAECQCTQAEIAARFGVDLSTIERRLQLPAYRNAWEQGRLCGLVSLRSAQFRKALDGNPTMLIWLGKQFLGQRDEQVLITEPTEVGTEPLTTEEWEQKYGRPAKPPSDQ